MVAKPAMSCNCASNLALGTVPDPRLEAFKAVKFAPEAAGNVAGNLPSGKVPASKTAASVDAHFLIL